MNLKLGIVSLVLIGMCGGLAAATISISGYVSNGGKPFPNKLINVHIAGYDTIAFTDSLGYYSTQVQTFRTQGMVQVQMVDTCGDTIRKINSISPRDTVFRLDLHGCLSSTSTFHLSGRLVNFQQSGINRPILVSFNRFQSVSDTLFADTSGFYSKHISSNQGFGLVYLGVSDCNNRFVSDSIPYRMGDSVQLNLDYCNTSSNMHRGKVFFGSTPVQPGMVHLLRYRFNSSGGLFHFVDTVLLDSRGEYQFIKDQFDYLLKAIPSNTRLGIAPTYFPSGLKWTDRNTLAIGPHSSGSSDIVLQQVRPVPGSGRISGEVKIDSSLVTQGFGAREVLVLDEFENVVAFDTVAANNQFSIPNLPNGKYRVWIDQCGIPTEAKWVDLTSAQPNYSGLIITASFQGIGNDDFVSNGELPEEVGEVEVYPNPFSSYFKLEGAINEVRLQVCDIVGNEIYDETISGELFVQTAAWKKGVYIFKITEGDKITTRQIVKK